MRVRVEYETNKEELPIEFRRKYISHLKGVFENYNQDLFTALYGGNTHKSFCFGVFFYPEVKVAREGISLYSKRFSTTFCTPDVMMGVHLANALMSSRNRWLPLADWDNQIKITSLTKLTEYPIVNNTVAFKALPPIIIRDHDEKTGKDWYLTWEDENFERVWKRNLQSELVSVFHRDVRSDVEALQIKPVRLRKTVVLHYNIHIPVTIGSFVLEGEKYLLEYIYKSGIGSRRSMGFGCLDII